jgi:peptidoglycan/xylan/chitin deacetylase (PgdA/CDA1 family)
MSELGVPIIPPVSVLTYHNIVLPGQESPNDIHSISIDRLNEHIAALTEAGFIQIPLAAAFDVLVHSQDHELGYVLTFDDGYVSLWQHRQNISSEVKPTVFILTKYTGESTISWNTRSSVILDHLDLDGIRELSDYGFDIQVHGTDHHNLLKFNDDQLRARFWEANDWFHNHLGKTPQYLAYPYGYCDSRIKAVVSEFFQGALSMTHGAWVGPEAQYALNRIGIPYYLTGSDVVTILQTPPESRWYEIESRAPWRKSKQVEP